MNNFYLLITFLLQYIRRFIFTVDLIKANICCGQYIHIIY